MGEHNIVIRRRQCVFHHRIETETDTLELNASFPLKLVALCNMAHGRELSLSNDRPVLQTRPVVVVDGTNLAVKVIAR